MLVQPPPRREGATGPRRPGSTLSQQLQEPRRPARQSGPWSSHWCLIPWLLPAAGAPRNYRSAQLGRQPRFTSRPLARPPPPPHQARPAPPRAPVLPPAGRARTCRTRCRASTKPSAFIPTGALCPCTSSAIAAPAAARLRRRRRRHRRSAPLSGLPLHLGTRSRKGKVAPLPAEGKPGRSPTREEPRLRGRVAARDFGPAGSGGAGPVVWS